MDGLWSANFGDELWDDVTAEVEAFGEAFLADYDADDSDEPVDELALFERMWG